ncbi:SDR family NAD(P)-dependent oxidoreductase [Pseudorhodobacter sp.]|uniref:SDR family NAD(P)-dependent oxidoreductase n=1 Tax=Pseudorhodobacter sp. TaxID=1934400 RepID=UPI002AFF8AA5|nr:SDR family NAD(P)-dependent oxidoreductase [Pseudorhodobacter sp.]
MIDRFAGRHLLLMGPGYAARAVALRFLAAGGQVSAALRDPARAPVLASRGLHPVLMDQHGELPRGALSGVTDLLVSAPPGATGCPALASMAGASAGVGQKEGLRWVGYYSSTAVYGDCGGAWIDESRAPAPATVDAKARLIAEAAWQAEAARIGAGLDIFRIAGIYGPEGRNVLAQLRSGKARAILKPGQVFNRIHRDDIAGATLAAMTAQQPHRLTNLADGVPCPASDILIGVAAMLGLPRPPEIAFDAAGLPSGAAAFYAENRRISNKALLSLPGFELRHKDWQAGYRAMIKAETI